MDITKRCDACGHEENAEARFCSNCGGSHFLPPLTHCPVCGAHVAPRQYCSNCGADLQNPSAQVWRICGNCRNPVHITQPSCTHCGASFAPVQQPAAQPVQQPVSQPPKPKKRKNGWVPWVIVVALLGAIGLGVDLFLENNEPQLNVPTTTVTQPSFDRPTRPTLPHLPTQTKPVTTDPKPTQPKPTEPIQTQPKPTEPPVTEPKPTQPKPTQPKPTEPESNIPSIYENNHYLNGIGDGYCETMTGDVVMLFVFVTDPTDGWSSSERSDAEEALLNQLRKLLEESKAYGADLNLYYVFEAATVDLEFDRDQKNWEEAAMAQLGLSDGYKDQRKLEEFYNADQVPVIFLVDEPGRSYAHLYYSGKGFESVVLLEKDYSALRHELCHVFGARDMYFPTETVDAAKAYLPNGIMYGDCRGDIDPLTAFILGWIDELTPEALAFLEATNGLTEEYIEEAKKQDQLTGYGTRYYEGGYYVGYLENGVRHGEGTYYWDSGAVYTGDWVHGDREGTGTMTYDDGAVYKGKWKNDQRNGKGKITYTNGNSYDGQWKDDDFHGTGTYTWKDGSVYKGDWSKGKRSGEGTMTWADGTVYTGKWSKDERNGEGTMTWPSGDKYVGQFKNGYRHGVGTYYYPNGNVFTGDWVDGSRTGKGTLTWADGSWYTGDWVDNQMTGKGERYYASYGTRYVGDFVNGKRHGYGTYYYADGTTWTGYWENDVRVD